MNPLKILASILIGFALAAGCISVTLLAALQYHEKTEGFTYSWGIEYVQIRHEGNKVEYLDKDGNLVLVRFE